jgi:PadR family transcriptional regulator, regulatory protein PadR
MEYLEQDRDRRVTQLRKGILELAVMGVLYRERHYGYSLIRELSENSSISLKEGTVYPILGRLDRDGLVRSEWVESDQGPPRKYYELTRSGRQLFDELSLEFGLLVSLVQQQRGTPSEQPEPARKKLFVRKA